VVKFDADSISGGSLYIPTYEAQMAIKRWLTIVHSVQWLKHERILERQRITEVLNSLLH
jgi:hypothetical protein